MSVTNIEEIASLAKRRGFIFPTSEIYGGLVSSYDYGPMGVLLMQNIKNIWWKYFVEVREDMVGLDSQIILHPRTWEASGHVANFNEPLVEDVVTNKRYRADHLIEKWLKDSNMDDVEVEEMDFDAMDSFIKDNKIKTTDGNAVGPIRKFNQLFPTHIGAIEGEAEKVYLRGETAQGIFSNFKNIIDSTRVKLPFGVAQIGKSFRNEITKGQYIFRTFEFEQAEIEYFFDPEKNDWEKLMTEWKGKMENFVVNILGIEKDNVRWRRHTDKERSHYSKDTYDFDYNFPFGWKELWGIAYRTDYDLKQHAEFSGVDLSYRDVETGRTFVPHVIEPAVGINRLAFMVLADAYEATDRVVLKFKPWLAPYKAAIFPLLPNKPELVSKAREIYDTLRFKYSVVWDDRGNIGKRYLSQDEIGTPWCITVDFDTLETGMVTIRDRDTKLQEKVAIAELDGWIGKKLDESISLMKE